MGHSQKLFEVADEPKSLWIAQDAWHCAVYAFFCSSLWLVLWSCQLERDGYDILTSSAATTNILRSSNAAFENSCSGTLALEIQKSLYELLQRLFWTDRFLLLDHSTASAKPVY